ncbi:hypothetical protein NQ314_015430 [Rhamnusium bicolor]|uniref:DDE-1 domain-containing protein n=1 Tax=Rhamnusium bicolor TaxID=1586634 RepID=A0AAV8WYU9_9CUCU|nr:hypothetical protein NQ314_015430 [Rhamnusium bicolor]
MNVAQLLPLTSDLLILAKILDSETDKLKGIVKNSCTKQLWNTFAILYTLSRIIIFNKRRSGEAAKMTLEIYSSRPLWSDQGTQELKNSLTPLENEKVPVLLTQSMNDILIKNKKEGEIINDHPYVFARSHNSTLYLRGHDCLRKASLDAGLLSAENVTKLPCLNMESNPVEEEVDESDEENNNVTLTSEDDKIMETNIENRQSKLLFQDKILNDSVEHIVKQTKRENKFSNNRPGDKWYKLFLRRHPEVSVRVSQNLTAARENVTEAQIRNWFAEIKEYLMSKKLFDITINHPDRVFNADEAAFFHAAKGREITANAAGSFAPPMIVFSYERVPSYVSASVPSNWGIGRSDTGWMCGATFFEYITNIFLPWLQENNIKRPILFFVDGHVSHMTLHLSRFCSANGIELFALYPNSTHLLQPMDVAVFRPLKNFWKKEVKKWRMANCGNKLQKHHFAPIFKEALLSITEGTLKNGFRVSGLSPFNLENVNFTKILSGKLLPDSKTPKNQNSNNVLLKELEDRMGENKVRHFQESISKEQWDGALEYTSLFQIWKDLITENQKRSNQ